MLEHVRIHINHCAASLSEFFDVCGQDAKFAALASRNKSNKSAKTGVGSGGFNGEFRV